MTSGSVQKDKVKMRKLFFKRYLILLISCFAGVPATAQELPPIEVYTPKTYGAENQNWAISQSGEKYIYTANNKGLLEFNGAKWTLYPSPNETIIRAVNVINGRIYTGCYMEFGYWEKDEKGILDYYSLSKDLPQPMIEDEQFWTIIAYEEWILFRSFNRIYLYNTGTNSFKIVESETAITKMFKAGESIYFQKRNRGLYKMESGKPLLVCNEAVVKDNVLVNVFPFRNTILLQTQEKGFYILNDNTLSRWDIPANDVLSEVSVYSSIRLKDKSFVLGTISSGMLHMTPEGAVNYEINKTNGLSNNTVLSVFEDADNNIWLGLDNGINCINIKSHFKIYNDDAGLLGTVYASAVHNGYLYLGTNQGLFCKKLNTNDDFSFIKGTKGQVWCLVNYKDTLFCGHNLGTFTVDKGNALRISSVPGTWIVRPVANRENMAIQGNFDGLYVLMKKNGVWQLKNKLEGFDISGRFFEINTKGDILVSHEYKGVFRLKISDDYTRVIAFEKDPTLLKGANSSLVKYTNSILYADRKGIFSYDEQQDVFVRDSVLSGIFDDDQYTSGKLVAAPGTNILWVFTAKNISRISAGKLSQAPKIDNIAVPKTLRKEMTGYENITHLKDQLFLYGTSGGYIIIDLEKINPRAYSVNINAVAVNKIDEQPQKISRSVAETLENTQNNIAFVYSVTEFDKYAEAEYQYHLEGFHNQWSDWTSEPGVLFKNLPYGDYSFHVKARVGNTQSQNMATYTFRIRRPWYLSNMMIAIYSISLLLMVLLIHNFYKRYYRKQREKLLERTQRELELKELENRQQRIVFDNERLKRDIEGKNRELAISTMSMIKKNQLLNDIKNELKNNEGKPLGPVVRIIDKNLNNTDDWKFFEAAFNNADKDFLKKIKEKHVGLTPNDLRICAYLRLNLSSKEIASLLNIAPRSVEIKRYRLRKKMNLPHQKNLVNYILEI